MKDELKIKMYAYMVDCIDPPALAQFYARLLKWEIMYQDEEWTCIGAPGTGQGAYPGISFQKNPAYRPPVWPEEPGKQQQMAHLDLAVNDMEEAVKYAVECGAAVAEKQFLDGCRVMLDPAGHPFCLCDMKPVIENSQFALL